VSLFKRGNVWWEYFYIDGIRHQHSTDTSNRRLAETVAVKLRQEARLRKHRLVEADPDITVGQVATRFLGDGGATPYHVGRLELSLPFFGERPVASLTRSVVNEYRSRRHRDRPNLSDATINRDVSVLRHILYWALDEQIIPSNPLARIRLVRERRRKRPVLGVGEEELLIPACADHLGEAVITGVDTGMRRGELTHQDWEDIDLDRNLLLVTQSKTVEGEAREIPLTARVHDLLSRRKQTKGLVFTYRGKPLKLLKTGWKGALRRSGIRRFRFHDLRHTFNTRLMEAGVMPDIRKSLMGHSTGDTNELYTHVELPAKREAIRKLERWIAVERTRRKEGQEADGQERASTGQQGDSGSHLPESPND
jgi:integrase